MFGILRPQLRLIDSSERKRYRRTYCNLCGLIGTQYGYRSRMLVVHDIATIWWLLERPDALGSKPLKSANCVRGGGKRLSEKGLSELQRLFAAISAYTIGIKVADDIADEPNWRSHAADRLYRRAFSQARRDLQEIDFNLSRLDSILASQKKLETEKEDDFRRAANPTMEAYALVAREIALRCESSVRPEQAEQLGQVLGSAVYLVDAIRDYESDVGNAYNPLCLASHSEDCTLPSDLYREVLTHVGRKLTHGRRIAAAAGDRLAQSWNAIERSLYRVAGVNDPRSVVLYSGCIMPCGDGFAVADNDDFGSCCAIICGGFCCWNCCC